MAIQIVIPMAGRGSRFEEAGYSIYKPFLPIGSKTMIERVIDNVTPSQDDYKVHIYCQEQHYGRLNEVVGDDARIMPWFLTGITEGAACTVLQAKDLIDNDDELIIANSDQLVDWDVDNFLNYSRNYDASILVLPTQDPKYSFAKTVGEGVHKEVLKTAEKQVISKYGTVGIYYWKKGSYFVKSAERMIEDNDRFNNEFYVCPTYNYMPRHLRIGIYTVVAQSAHFLGAPAEYQEFISNYKE